MSDNREVSTEVCNYSVNEIQTIAGKMAATLNKKPDELFTKMMIAQAEGIHIAHADQIYHVIHGTACLKAAEIQSRFQESGGVIKWITSNSEECTAKFSHPKGSDITITWTKQRAIQAKLWGQRAWGPYPENMLRSRTLSEGVRYCYPACLRGKYSVEEMEDVHFDEMRNVTTPATETPKAPDFKPQEPRNVSPQPEDEPDFEGEFMDDDTGDLDFTADPAPDETIYAIETWNYYFKDIDHEAGKLACEWAATLTEDEQADISDLFEAEKDDNIDIGVVRALCKHPKIVNTLFPKRDITIPQVFEQEYMKSPKAEEIESFMKRCHDFILKP